MVPSSFFALGNRLRHAVDRTPVDWGLALACVQMAVVACLISEVVRHYLEGGL